MSAAIERPGFTAWVLSILGAAAAVIATQRGPLAEGSVGSPTALFWIVTIAAGLCGVVAAAVVVFGWRAQLAEVALLGGALWVVSVLPLVHGLTAPGVLYDDNTAVVVSALAALPVGLIAALPLLMTGRAAVRLAQRWRWWVAGWVVAATAAASVLLARPNLVDQPALDSPVVALVGLGAAAAALAVSWRHLRLYWLGRRTASYVTALGIAFLGLSGLVWLDPRPFTIGWWFAHVLDIVGVFAACFGLLFAHRRDRGVADVLAPVLNRNPLVALELGLCTPVHDLVEMLEDKDQTTRDHVVRVGELAMRLGVRAGFEPERLRPLGLAALLHDLGKVAVPDAVLDKPGRLDAEERAAIERHSLDGYRMLLEAPPLVKAAPFVRWHHEKLDGSGYPDGLSHEIPLESRIISVCDAWDAMTHTRQYRQGMPHEKAFTILRRNTGTQFDIEVVVLLEAEIRENGPVIVSEFDDVGYDDDNDEELGDKLFDDPRLSVCSHSLPPLATGG